MTLPCARPDRCPSIRVAFRRWAPVTLAAALALGLSACGGNEDNVGDRATVPTPRPPPPPLTASLTGGLTTLKLDATTRRVLRLAGVTLRPTGDAQGSDGRLRFPITGGELELSPTGGEIAHAGGLRFSGRGRQVDATDLVVDPANNVITAAVEGKRVPLLVLDLQFPRELPPTGEEIAVRGDVRAFGSTVVAALGSALRIEDLAGGLPLGSVLIAART